MKDNLGKIINFLNCCATLKESCTSLIYGINPKYCVLNNKQFFLIKHFYVKQARNNPHSKNESEKEQVLKDSGERLARHTSRNPLGYSDLN